MLTIRVTPETCFEQKLHGMDGFIEVFPAFTADGHIIVSYHDSNGEEVRIGSQLLDVAEASSNVLPSEGQVKKYFHEIICWRSDISGVHYKLCIEPSPGRYSFTN